MSKPPAAWDDHVRLLRLGGRPAWLVDGQGGVVWAGPGAARPLPDGAVPGQPAAGLHWEAVAGGWAAVQDTDLPASGVAHLLDPLPIPVFWKDRAGRYQGCNNAFAELVELPAEALLGRTVHGLYPAELAAKYHAMDQDLMAGGPAAIQRYEWDIGTASGGGAAGCSSTRPIWWMPTARCWGWWAWPRTSPNWWRWSINSPRCSTSVPTHWR